ncbi:hypothetical protein BCU68_01320 [Vibrio sp. 10N.286.49.B3]|uniref:tetratricopeptide repeat protein n=1 Tax=Vibrio sp. 10N.286.49.B3 TaxID=1880855 RepID=UPI000CC2ADC1|nr:tetratricopeptide repeat protein [Vibrio sp. 10N.286.49.B3]PMH46703.1 hypothetical protein BCU68_01320 [Vibrio sp. 10N.286.49.B3]
MLGILSGCAAPKSSLNSFDSQESMLAQTQNHSKLILLYKEELKVKDSVEMRIKLANSYLQSGDPESALFVISPATFGQKPPVEALLIQAHSQYELEDFTRAEVTAKRAYELDPKNAEIENFLGVIYAGNGKYPQARTYFNLARTHFYDDVKIKNNLAVLDIIEGDYKQGVQRLLPVYLNGQADKQVEANLTLAMAKLGNYDYVKSLLIQKFSNHEISERYAALRGLKSITTQEASLAIDPPTATLVPLSEESPLDQAVNVNNGESHETL